MLVFPSAPRTRGCVATGRCFFCRQSSISFRPFRPVACVCFRHSACLPAVGKYGCLPASRQCVPSTARACFPGRRVWVLRPAARQAAEIPAPTIWVPGVRLSRRPVHVASRRRELARHSVFSSGSLPLRLHGNGAASLFLRRRALRVAGSGRLSGHLCVRFEQTIELLGGWLPGSPPIRMPDVCPRGSAQQSGLR